MTWEMKLWLTDGDEKIFGSGPRALLRGVEREGSLKRAAESMGMAYSKAFGLIGRAERALGVALLVRETGGRHGGGSALTAEARALLERYDAFEQAARAAVERLYAERFGITRKIHTGDAQQ